MKYSLEAIYSLVGRTDSVAVLTLHENSEAYKMFGKDITVVFLYNQFEREQFEENYQAKSKETTYGKIKAKYLGNRISKSVTEKIRIQGIHCNDIKSIFASPCARENLYYKEDERFMREITIPMKVLPKGGDNDWMYGFKKRLVNEGVGLSPYDRESYLAMKLFYEEENLTKEENDELRIHGTLKPIIEEKYLDLKFDKELITEEEKVRLKQLWVDSMDKNYEILKKELNSSGVSIKKIRKENPALFGFLLKGISQYIPRNLNSSGSRAIYLDFKGFLHVFLRHVQEFEVSDQFKNKDNFLWKPDEIIVIMGKVISSVNKEIQEFWKEKPNQRYSKYGRQSLYFEGDYYTFHIEADGRLSTFHKNKKKDIEKSDAPTQQKRNAGGFGKI